MAEDGTWRFDPQGVSRISPDPDDEEAGRVTYSVAFDAYGYDATAEIEVFVGGVPDPAQIIVRAMAHLHDALTAWAQITLGRRIVNGDAAQG